MNSTVDQVLARAFKRVPASNANTAIEQVREEEGSAFGWGLSYEAVVPASTASLEQRSVYLEQTLLPRWVYFLQCRGTPLPTCPGVFLSLFVGEELHFIRGADFVAVLVEATGLSPAEMVRRYGG